MRFRSLICALLLFLAAPLAAQPATVPVSYTISASHAGVNTTDYKLTIDGTEEATKPVSGLVGGVIAFTGSKSLTVGSHTAEIIAIGPGGQAKSSGAFTVSAAPPSAPGTVTIVIQVVSGP